MVICKRLEVVNTGGEDQEVGPNVLQRRGGIVHQCMVGDCEMVAYKRGEISVLMTLQNWELAHL